MKKSVLLFMITILMMNIFPTTVNPLIFNRIPQREGINLPSLRNSYINQPESEELTLNNPKIEEIQIESSVQATTLIGSIQVNVFDYVSSKPIALADVSVTPSKGESISGPTDKAGQFVVSPLSEGNYTVTVNKTGYQSDSKSVQLTTRSYQIFVTFELSKIPLDSGFLEIYVYSTTKEPLEGAVVSLYDEAGILVITDKTDKVGFLNITDLFVGKYKMLISKSEYVSQKKGVSIDIIGDSDRILIYLTLLGSGEGYIEVITLDLKGNYLEGVTVQVSNSTNDPIYAGQTDKNGFYNVTELEIGHYNLTVSLSGFSSQSMTTTIDYPEDADRLKFVLTETVGVGYILGLIMNETGNPLNNANLKVFDPAGTQIVSLSTNEDGYCNFTNLPTGYWYHLQASAEGYVSDADVCFLGVDGRVRVAFFLRKPYVGNIELTVVNETGSQIGGALCEVYDHRLNLVRNNWTDDNGFFNFTSLNIGKYQIFVYYRGYKTAIVDAMITFNGDIDELLIKLVHLPTTLPNTGRVNVYVKDSEGKVIPDAFVRVVGDYIVLANFTGEKGEFIASDLYLGLYNITVAKKGYTDSFDSTKIDYVGDQDTLEIFLYTEDTGTIDFYISGKNLPDQSGESWIRYQIEDGSWSKWIPTDDDGHVTLPNLKIGNYNLEILRPGFELQTQVISVSSIGGLVHAGSILDFRAADGTVENWALIVAGQYDRRFTIDAFAMYMTLRNYYSYDADHIFLLTPRDTHPTSGNTVPRDRVTSLENVQWAINEIAWLSDADDKVLIWWTGHGGYGEMDAFTDDITATQFDTLLDSIICGQMYIFLGPCHSASMIPYLDDEQNRVIYTSCNTHEGGHAYFEHSYWPWATYTALHPLAGAPTADDNSNGYISLFEIFDYSYDFILIDRGYTDQHPQRWVGTDVTSDSISYLGDGTYSSPIIEMSIEYLIIETYGPDLYDGVTNSQSDEIEVIASVNILDTQLDHDDFVFQAINISVPNNQSLMANVTVDIYFLNGSFYTRATTNSSGFLIFYDVPEGDYGWEAFYDSSEVDSGSLTSDGLTFSVSSYPENWDHQGDYGDIRFSVEESTSHIFIMDATILLYMNNGTLVGECVTGYIGAGFIYDITDGSYGWEAFYNGKMVDEGIVEIDSSLFLLESDEIAPTVRILSPNQGETIDLRIQSVVLSYGVTEQNNYTILVFLNDGSIGYKSNYSHIVEITSGGNYTLRVQATDIAGNIGLDEVEFSVYNPEPTTSDVTTTSTESSGGIAPGFELFFTLLLFVFVSIRKKRT